MKNKVSFLCLLIVASLLTACKQDVTAEYIQNGNSSLRLFEESTGSLLDLKNGMLTVELEGASLNPLNDSITLRLKSSAHTYLIKIQKSKITADGSFELNETDLEQPIRMSGKITTGLTECSFANLINAEKIGVEIKVFKGFSALESPIGYLKTELKVDAGAANQNNQQARL